MNRILVLTDFSDNSWNALFTALKLYEDSETKFYVLNCFEPKFDNLLGDKSKERLAVIYESLSKNSVKELGVIESYLQKNHTNQNHHFEMLSLGEDILSALNLYTKENPIDLVVMGTRGATRSKEIFMGSNTVKVIRKFKKCPVLAVPEDHDFKSLDKIVFPTDHSHGYTRSQLSFLLQLAERWNSEINVFQVSLELQLSEEQRANKQQLEKYLSPVAFRFRDAELKVNIKDAIKQIVKDSKADMITLIYYSHTILEKLTREPVVKRMAFYSPVPLLVLPE